MLNYIRKVEKINIIMISTYGLALIISMFYMSYEKVYMMMIDFVASVGILIFMNEMIKKEPIYHRSPFYYYAFLGFVTVSVYIDGANHSIFYPVLFILPVLYVAVNFPRKGSTGIAIFAVTIIWLIRLQDPMLIAANQVNQTILYSVIILALPQLVGFLVKEYVSNMKNLVKESRPQIDNRE